MSGVWTWHGRLGTLAIQIKAGILLGIEVKPCAGFLRSLICLWHSLFNFGLLFFFSHLSHKQGGCCQGFAGLSWGSYHLCCPSSGLADCILPVSREQAGFKGNKVLPHALPEFFTVLMSLGCMRRNIKYMRTFQKLKGPPAKMEMTMETPFPWMKSPCQCSQRNQMLAVQRESQCQFLLIQDKRTL